MRIIGSELMFRIKDTSGTEKVVEYDQVVETARYEAVLLVLYNHAIDKGMIQSLAMEIARHGAIVETALEKADVAEGDIVEQLEVAACTVTEAGRPIERD